MKRELEALTGYGIIAGCDEAGRGCLAGPVHAAAVIFPEGYHNSRINDSKKLPEKLREELAKEIKRDSMSWGIGSADAREIDEINILQASVLAMHRGLDALTLVPDLIMVDGNYFRSYNKVPHRCFVKGDARFLAIAAASILAKTSRDQYMKEIGAHHPDYGWITNKGYPTPRHLEAIGRFGLTPFHRRTFRVKNQLMIPFE